MRTLRNIFHLPDAVKLAWVYSTQGTYEAARTEPLPHHWKWVLLPISVAILVPMALAGHFFAQKPPT